jgi:hypothetical protein
MEGVTAMVPVATAKDAPASERHRLHFLADSTTRILFLARRHPTIRDPVGSTRGRLAGRRPSVSGMRLRRSALPGVETSEGTEENGMTGGILG